MVPISEPNSIKTGFAIVASDTCSTFVVSAGAFFKVELSTVFFLDGREQDEIDMKTIAAKTNLFN
jgi:hypothetical protein